MAFSIEHAADRELRGRTGLRPYTESRGGGLGAAAAAAGPAYLYTGSERGERERESGAGRRVQRDRETCVFIM